MLHSGGEEGADEVLLCVAEEDEVRQECARANITFFSFCSSICVSDSV